MATIITYDINSRHREVKEAMSKLGYTITFTDGTKPIYLPNTTLYHSSKNCVTARDELKGVCASLHVDLERCVASSMDDWAAIYGIPL